VAAPDASLIHSDPKILSGKPVIKGTRLSVELILSKLAGDESVDDILETYPQLTRKSVLAAIEFAYRVIKMDLIRPQAFKD
jgi:uncharacterized protein (DUF433 family)